MLDDLDDLIDKVAREVTDSQPSVDFTRRVASRLLELKSNGVRRRERQPVWLLTAAAACIVVLAVFVAHHRLVRQPVGGGRSDATSSTVSTEAPAQSPESQTPVAEPIHAATRAQARGRLSDDATPAAPAVTTSSDGDLAPLVMTPLEMEPLGVAALAQAIPIEVDALSIERIDIAAMP
jgi:hypothetical protein